MCVMISQNSLFGQVSLVLALNSEADKTLQFVSLNSLDLKSLVLDALANLAAFFEVIEADLLGRLGVHTDLVTVYTHVLTCTQHGQDTFEKHNYLLRKNILTGWFGREHGKHRVSDAQVDALRPPALSTSRSHGGIRHVRP